MEIGTLVKELERQKETSLDLIVDSRSLRAAPDGGRVVELEIPDQGKYPLTPWAHLQMAEKLGIPKKYYDRMVTAGKAELLAENINAWIGEKDRRLVRVLDRQIRAILSDRYRIMDNYDLLFLAMEEFRKKETVEIYKAEVTETMLYLKAIDRTLTAEITRGDIIYGGLIIRNSEVGASAFRVETFILRKICSNGLIGEHALKKVHLGKQTMEIGEIDWSDETRELEDKTLWAKARDIIKLTFDSSIFSSWVKKMRESTEIAIGKPIKAVNNVARLANLSEEQRDDLLAYFSEHTKYGLVNAITSLARETKSADEQIRLEGFGGKLLNAPDEEFEQMIA
jgi:hypothetical protein